MICFENVKFDAKGADKKAKVFGLTLSGAEDVEIKNCEFANIGYSSILNNSTGKVKVSNCVFNCDNVYNPIEGSQSVDNGNVNVENCEFKGAPGNNYINFYQFADGSHHEIRGCHFEPTVDNNMLRISNRESAAAEFVVADCEYSYVEGEPTDYTAFLLCQDYTAKSGKPQDFTNCCVSFNDVIRDGEKLSAESEYVSYVYEDGKGLITEENQPKILFN